MLGTARRFVALGAAVACSGCISLLPQAPPPGALYTLEPDSLDSVAPPAVSATAQSIIAVDAPTGLPTFLGDDIAWQEDNSVAFVAGASWTGQARTLLQRLLVEYLVASADVRAAAASGEGPRPTHLLRWDVSEFQVLNADGRSEARFTASAYLLNARSRELIATLRVAEREALQARSSRAAALALRAVARRGAGQVSAWAAREARGAPAPAAPFAPQSLGEEGAQP